MSSAPNSERKPRVVCLGKPKFIGDDYLEEFQKDFDYDFLDVTNHQQALEKLPLMIAEHGPIDAFVIRMGRPPFRPFNEDRSLHTVASSPQPQPVTTTLTLTG
ncbi:hypothetical protein CEP52_014288 [Fusarium oligoseptatum]|uniref:Uncharacterized protein n=1 Tax=Fusarium oligoseptatum TaxID=2604345 RepID=A0A428SNA1_9HYPO|nr:hypothetical protein CEP52_014288 [Fusarium oligoseptatum]